MRGAVTGPAWGEEEVRFLRENVSKLSCGDMARELGRMGYSRSRNSIVGKLFRLGLSVGRPPAKIAKLKPVSVRESTIETKRVASSLNARLVREEKAKTVKPNSAKPAQSVDPLVAHDIKAKKGWPKPMTETAVRFLDLPRLGRCRMPLWADNEPLEGMFCCGAATEGTATYCHDCKALTVGDSSRRAA